ncbi:YbeD family protein [Amphritea sp.]|uniref:YbeD family protein n=1 Tax=Amphritea sp. TaxID=1872502 RepID=UPI003A904138
MAQETKPEAPKIEFPCPDYPIKVIGRDGPDFQSLVIDVVRIHAPDLDITKIDLQGSSKGTFTSIRMKITATGHEQLKALHEDLLETGRVTMVI